MSYINDFIISGNELLINSLPKGKTVTMNGDLKKSLNEWISDGYEELAKILNFLDNAKGDVILSDYNDKTFSFNYHRRGESKKQVTCRYGDFVDNFPQIAISEPNLEKKYDCDKLSNNKLFLKLETVSYRNKTNEFHRYLSPHTAYITFSNNGYEVDLTINNPNKEAKGEDPAYILPYEEALKDRLLKIYLPMEIHFLLSIIEDIIGGPERFPLFNLCVKEIVKNNQQEKKAITDIMNFNNQKLVNYIRTNNDKSYVISMNENGEYTLLLQNLESINTDDLQQRVNDVNKSVERDYQFTRMRSKK